MKLTGLLCPFWLAASPVVAQVSSSPTQPGQRNESTQQRVKELERILQRLVETYGVSGMEAPVRTAVEQLLPEDVASETDSAGNLWVTIGKGNPVVVFVAHMDEIGFRVSRIREDGTLDLEAVGGLFPWLWEGKPALVHIGEKTVPGVFLPRDTTGNSPTRAPPSLRADVGTTSQEATAALGIRVGHTLTMPKEYRRLAGYRATGRSFDDRAGTAAQILALRRLDRSRLRHTVVFVWSVREEIGLEGAEAVAQALKGRAARVHPIDTFVSADSPIEPQNFAVAPPGRGSVARALDNSSVTPPPLVDSLVAVARLRRIPFQVGTTNGGNDGSVFGAYGVPDVPIGWPLRYSHSPVETLDLRDVLSLTDIIVAVAERW